MKKAELKQVIKEEISKVLKEGAISKAIKPSLQGEVKVAVEALEKRLVDLISLEDVTRNAEELAYNILDIIDAAKQEARDEYID